MDDPYAASRQSINHWHKSFLLVAICVSALPTGCGDGRPERVKVAGQVLIDGQPLPHGSVLFMPAQGRPSGGGLDSEGRFELTCYEKGDGAMPGEYRVAISGVEIVSETLRRHHAPLKYGNAQTSGLTAIVEEAKDDYKFELTWGGGKPFEEMSR